MTIYTTLNKIRACSPCGIEKDSMEEFRKLLNFLGKTTSDDEPLKFSTILESNGIDDALWCLQSIYGTNAKEIRLLAADYAERVLPLWENWAKDNAPEHLNAPRKAIEEARRFANGKILPEQLEAARSAAWAAENAAWDARAAWAAWAARSARAAETAGAAWSAGAAWDAWDAGDAGDAEREAQAKLLIKYFG